MQIFQKCQQKHTRKHSHTQQGGFNPPIKLPTPHPLTVLLEKMKRKMEKSNKSGGDSRQKELFPADDTKRSQFLKALVSKEGLDVCVEKMNNDGDSLHRYIYVYVYVYICVYVCMYV